MPEVSDAADGVVAVSVPQINVNDEQVVLVNWRVADGESVREGDPLYEAETSKSVDELPAPASGILRHVARVGDTVAVGQTIAYIGPSAKDIEQYVNHDVLIARSKAEPTPTGPRTIDATAGAIELADRYGLDLAEVPAEGKVRRMDVERFLQTHGLLGRSPALTTGAEPQQPLPLVLEPLVEEEPSLSEHQWSVARHLAATRSRIVPAHVAMDVHVSQALAWVNAKQKAGQMVSLLTPLLYATAAAVRAVPKLASFRLGRSVYRYLSTDLAYTARSPDGRLFTPVVRAVDGRSLDDLAGECARLNMALFRGQLTAADLTGGCLTLSVLNEQPVRWHVGLQNAYQSGLITAGAVYEQPALVNGQLSNRSIITVTLSYDHGLLDGWEAANALQAFKTAVESLSV